jgi:hypothetical protein
MTPTVNNATLAICTGEYFFPLNQPAAIVVTDPKLRKMICTGTLMLKAKAQLFNILTAKNMAADVHHLRIGTRDDLKK